jgi:hypothetical protein
MSEQALHPASWARAAGREEDELRAIVWGHAILLEQGLGSQRRGGPRGYGSRVGSWYWIGVSVGLGAAAGVLVAGWLGAFIGLGREWPRITPVLIGVALAIGGGVVIGAVQPGDWAERIGGAVAALLGLRGAISVVFGTLRRGGTRGGTAILVTAAALAAAAVAFIPAAGYLEALAVPALAVRLRRTQPERYAGLRTLARD